MLFPGLIGRHKYSKITLRIFGQHYFIVNDEIRCVMSLVLSTYFDSLKRRYRELYSLIAIARGQNLLGSQFVLYRNLVSSAKSRIELYLIERERSLILIRNNKGPRTFSCGLLQIQKELPMMCQR